MATDTQNYDTMSPIEKLIMAAQIISPPLDTPTIKVISVQNSPINLSLKDQQTVNSGSKSPVTTPEKPLFYWKHKNKYLAQKEPLPILNKSKLEDNNVAKILPLDRKTCEISLQEKSVPQITNIRLLTTIYGIEQPNIETSKKYLSLNPDIFSLHGQDSPTFSSLKTSGKVINIPQTLKPTNESYSRVKSLRAYRMCNSSSHVPSQFSSIGSSISKPGIPKLSAHEVSHDDISIRPVILHPTKQLSSQVQIKSEGLIKTIGFAPARSQIIPQQQSRIVTSSLQRSIMESQNVSPLIITPTPHVTHTSNDVVPAKIVPIPSTPAVSHFSVINKPGLYDNVSIPDYKSYLPGAPPVYTHSDFARFTPKSYHHKSSLNSAIIHGPIPGNNDEPCNIPSSQHVFKPIISPRPSILRKRDAEGVLRAQKNLIPIITKPDPEDCRNMDEPSINRNGYSSESTGLQIESIMVPQVPEVILPRITALSGESHMLVEISPRKKPRKQLLPVNQGSPFKIVGDEMEYVDEKVTNNDKSEEFPDDDVDCNDDCADGDAEDEAEDDLDDNEMDVDDDCPADDDYDENDEDDDDFGNDFEDGFDYVKSDKTLFEEVKTSADLSDGSSSYSKLKNKRPTLWAGCKSKWRGHSHHFLRYTDFKIKETKKQVAEMQQNRRWLSDSKSGWKVQRMLKQFYALVKNEEELCEHLRGLIDDLEVQVADPRLQHVLVELCKDNIQRSKVTRDQLEEIIQQLTKLFDYKILIDDIVDKYCPKDLKKKMTGKA